MNVRNCRKCGRLFNYVMGPITCPACRDALEEKFKEVKEYVRDNPNCGIDQVSKDCDVEVSQIKQWLREERLQFSESSMVQLTCENCGALIRSGKYCEKCKNEVANGFKNIVEKARPQAPAPQKNTKENPRMRFLDN